VAFSKVKGTPLAISGSSLPVRYAIRQVLDQEYQKEMLRRQTEAQQARYTGGSETTQSLSWLKPGSYALGNNDGEKENPDDAPRSKASQLNGPKRDFFGRIVVNEARPGSRGGTDDAMKGKAKSQREMRVIYREGYSNAVRKRISLNELMSGL
jgi:chromosome transmission fidelity protein 18